MKALVQEKYGPTEVLRIEEVELPTPGPGEVLVRVKAAGVNMADWHMMAGKPGIMRLFGVGFSGPKQRIRGTDVAGVVEEIGDGVTEFAVGDEVFGSARGTFAEFATARVGRLVAKPKPMSFEQAAVAGMAGYTALQAMRATGVADETTGQNVMVIGAAGGVGSFSVLLAKHFGARVTGVCSTAKVELVRSLGADAVIDYKTEQLSGTFDAIIDTAGNRSLRELRALLAPRGTLVIVGAEGGGNILGALKRNLRAAAFGPFVSQTFIGLMATEKREDLVELGELLASGAITPAIDAVYPLADAAEAIRHLADGRAAGKVVVVP